MDQLNQAINHSARETASQPNLQPTTPPSNLGPINGIAAWYIGLRIRAFIFGVSFLIVFAAGNFYTKHHSGPRLALYCAALGFSALVAVYLNLIASLQKAPNRGRQLIVWVVGSASCGVCFFFLWLVSLSVLY